MIHQGLSEIVRDDARRREKAPVIGEVSKVFPKESDSIEEANIEVNVQTIQFDHEFRRVPVIGSDHSGHTRVPQVGDYVIVQFTAGRGTEAFITGASTTDENRAPNARPGHWRHEWGTESERLYLEASPADNSAGTPDTVRFALKEGGLSEPTTEVAVDNSGSDPEITLKTDGNVSVSANGNVSVSANGNVSVDASGDVSVNGGSVTLNADEVTISGTVFADHTHNFTDAEGSTKSTDSVN